MGLFTVILTTGAHIAPIVGGLIGESAQFFNVFNVSGLQYFKALRALALKYRDIKVSFYSLENPSLTSAKVNI
jgi:hypothetical protein